LSLPILSFVCIDLSICPSVYMCVNLVIIYTCSYICIIISFFPFLSTYDLPCVYWPFCLHVCQSNYFLHLFFPPYFLSIHLFACVSKWLLCTLYPCVYYPFCLFSIIYVWSSLSICPFVCMFVNLILFYICSFLCPLYLSIHLNACVSIWFTSMSFLPCVYQLLLYARMSIYFFSTSVLSISQSRSYLRLFFLSIHLSTSIHLSACMSISFLWPWNFHPWTVQKSFRYC